MKTIFSAAALQCLSIVPLCYGMVVHPIVMHGSKADKKSPSNSPPELVIFLHGRLEANAGENMSIPEPSELYGDFLSELSNQLPPQSQVLIPAYHEQYSEWKREPRDLTSGPVTSAISRVIHDHLVGIDPSLQAAMPRHLTLISFSMGAAIMLKLLANDPMLHLSTNQSDNDRNDCTNRVDIKRLKLILIEPVWRCWLPFAVSEASSSIGDPTRRSSIVISHLPALAIAGTKDEEVRHDSGCMGQNSMDGVRRSLRPFLPNVQVAEIEGGNHFGALCSGVEDVTGEVELEGLRTDIVERISQFCKWQ